MVASLQIIMACRSSGWAWFSVTVGLINPHQENQCGGYVFGTCVSARTPVCRGQPPKKTRLLTHRWTRTHTQSHTITHVYTASRSTEERAVCLHHGTQANTGEPLSLEFYKQHPRCCNITYATRQQNTIFAWLHSSVADRETCIKATDTPGMRPAFKNALKGGSWMCI